MGFPGNNDQLSASRLRLFVFFALTFTAVLYVYRQTYFAPFILDDEDAILRNGTIRHLSRILTVLSPPRNTGAGGRPLVNLTYAINYAISGLNPWSYHLFNLGVHLATGAFLFAALRNMLGQLKACSERARDQEWIAGIVTVLWMLHPIHTESVIYISQRTECGAALCYVATFYFFLRCVGEETSLKWRLACVGSCAAGMLFKETMVTAPVLLFLFDVLVFSNPVAAVWRARRALYLGLASTWVLLGLSVFDLSKRSVGFGQGFTWWSYALLETKGVTLYLIRTLWPSSLVFDYGPLKSPPPLSLTPYSLVCASIILTTGFGLIRGWKFAFLGLAFLLLLAPSSSIIPVVQQPIAEHRMYLASAVVIFAAVLGSYRVARNRGLLLWCGVVVGLGFATNERAKVYRTAISLWEDTSQKTPTNVRAAANLGVAYSASGRTSEAVAIFRRVLALDPTNPSANNGLGNLWYESQNYSAAAEAFRRAIKTSPGRPHFYANLGNALLNLGRAEEAIASYRLALQIDGTLTETHHSLGCALAANGNPQEALVEFNKALELSPDFAPAREAIVKLRGTSFPLAPPSP